MAAGVNIVYQGRKGRSSYSGNRRLSEVKTKRPICAISNLPMGSSDPRLRYFLVHGKEVPINVQEFIDFCVRVGWPDPGIRDKKVFEIELWLIERAVEAAHLPAKQVGNRWSVVTEFARLIGLKTNFIKAVRVDA